MQIKKQPMMTREREDLSIISMSVACDNIPHMQYAETFQEAGDVLKVLYKTSTTTRILYLRNQLYGMRIAKGC